MSTLHLVHVTCIAAGVLLLGACGGSGNDNLFSGAGFSTGGSESLSAGGVGGTGSNGGAVGNSGATGAGGTIGTGGGVGAGGDIGTGGLVGAGGVVGTGGENADPRAGEALAIFCYQAKKWIGAFAAALGGLDTLVFAGGIGENSAAVRQRICEGLQHLGIEIDGPLNHRQAGLVSCGRVAVRVIRTDEECVIAESTARLLGMQSEDGKNGTS